MCPGYQSQISIFVPSIKQIESFYDQTDIWKQHVYRPRHVYSIAIRNISWLTFYALWYINYDDSEVAKRFSKESSARL